MNPIGQDSLNARLGFDPITLGFHDSVQAIQLAHCLNVSIMIVEFYSFESHTGLRAYLIGMSMSLFHSIEFVLSLISTYYSYYDLFLYLYLYFFKIWIWLLCFHCIHQRK